MRLVITLDAAIRLAQDETDVAAGHRLLAPTLLRSQFLAHLFAAVRAGEFDRRAAERQLDYLRGLRLRLLGDRVLQRVAWRIADERGWPDTYLAEYAALTQLQADALVAHDQATRDALGDVVPLVPFTDLTTAAG